MPHTIQAEVNQVKSIHRPRKYITYCLCQTVIADCGATTLLISLLYSPDQKVQENSVTTLLNLSINDINKAAIADANVIKLLNHVFETGRSEVKVNREARSDRTSG